MEGSIDKGDTFGFHLRKSRPDAMADMYERFVKTNDLFSQFTTLALGCHGIIFVYENLSTNFFYNEPSSAVQWR
jgi:hypothetical protein